MKTKEEIKKLLQKHPILRDSDPHLIATYWHTELKIKGIDLHNITGYDLLKEYLCKSKLTSSETIRRMRAKIQEEDESLRGKYYQGRQTVEQNKMKSKLGYNVEMSCEVKKKDHYPITWLFLNESENNK